MSYTEDAITALLNLSAFDRSRFAYLAVTGKMENAVRDHLAFSIQSGHNNVLVGRDITLNRVSQNGNGEKRKQEPRFDFVVFDQNGHLAEATEAKLLYTFDYRAGKPPNVVGQICTGVLNDAERLVNLANAAPNAAVHLLLLVCHANAQTPKTHFDKVSKYDLHLSARHPTEDFTPCIFAGFQKVLKDWRFASLESIKFGECFGISVGLTPIIATYNRKPAR